MKNLLILSLVSFSIAAMADTPPPGTVKAKMFSGDGNTGATFTGSGLNVNITGGSGLTSTVNQGTAGSSSWLEQITSSALPANACQESGGNLAAILSKLDASIAVTGTFWQTTQPVSGTVTVSNFPTPIASVGVTNFPSSQAVTGTFFQATQPVSGTFWQTTQPVSGNLGRSWNLLSSTDSVNSVQSGTWTDTVTQTTGANLHADIDNFPSSQAVTGTFFQATQPVSGTFWQTTQPVSGSVSVSNFPGTQPISGTVTANIGTSGSLALDSSVTGLRVAQGSTTSGQSGSFTLGAVTSSSPSYTSGQTSPFSLTLAGGLRVDGSGVTQPVSGTFWQTTQPVSAASLPLPIGAATSALQTTGNTSLTTIATNTPALGQTTMTGSSPVVIASNQSSIPVTGTFWQSTQPVSIASAVSTKAPVNANATLSARQTVTTSETNLVSPSNAVAVIVECESGNSDNLRWGFSNAVTAILSSTLGMLCEPGRSENIPVGAGTYLHMISTGSVGTDTMDVQWVLSQ